VVESARAMGWPLLAREVLSESFRSNRMAWARSIVMPHCRYMRCAGSPAKPGATPPASIGKNALSSRVSSRRPSVTAARESDQPPPTARNVAPSRMASAIKLWIAAADSLSPAKKSALKPGGFIPCWSRPYRCSKFLWRGRNGPAGPSEIKAPRLLSGTALLLLRGRRRWMRRGRDYALPGDVHRRVEAKCRDGSNRIEVVAREHGDFHLPHSVK